MAEIGCDLLFLADRLPGRDEASSLKTLFRGLEHFGHSWRLICCSAEFDHGLPALIECRGLGRRWQRPWAIRGLNLGDQTSRPRLLHVLAASMAEIRA